MGSLLKDKKIPNIIEYALIIALYYTAGGAFSYNNYSIQITLFFVISAVLLCLRKNALNKFFNSQCLVILLFICLFLLIVPILNSDSISTYIAIMMQLAIGAFCASIIPKENFKEKYVKVIVFFATVSIICFGISLIYPQAAYMFPKSTVEDASVYYYNAFIHVFMQPKGYGGGALMVRNAGICWEPGCYQAFLNIGLFFLLNKEERERQKRFLLKFFILIVAICTTVSTTGVILMAIILCRFYKVWFLKVFKNFKFAIVFFLIGAIGIVILVKMDFFGAIFDKMGNEFVEDDGNLFLERISLDRIIYLFKDGFWFLGMSFVMWQTYDVTLWNSVIHSILCLGIPFTTIQIYLYCRGAKKLSKHCVILFIIMILSCFTETLFWRVFFNTMAFYGIVEKEG